MAAAGTELAPEEGDDGLGGSRRPLTVGLVLLVTLVAFEALAAATAFPVVVDQLGGVGLYGWAFSGFMLTSLVGITLAGQEADRRGPGPPLLAGAAVFGAGLVVVGAAPAMWVVVAGRAVQGLGAGALPAVVYVVIGRAYPERLRPRMFAVLSSAWVVPGLVGPAISGFVAEHLSWRLVFAGILPLLVAAVALTLPGLGALGPAGAGAAPQTGRALRVAAATGLVIGGLGAHAWWSVPLVAAGAGAGLPALARLLPAGTLRGAHGLPAAILVRGMLTFAFFGAEAFLPLLLTSVRGQSATMAGVALTAATLSWTAGAWVQARAARRWPIRRFAVLGVALVAAGLAALTASLADGVPIVAAWAAWALAGLGMGMAYPMSSLVVLGDAPEAEVGAATASLQLSDMLGVALGTGIGGAIVALGAAAGWSRGAAIGVVDAAAIAMAAGAIAVAVRLPGRTVAASS